MSRQLMSMVPAQKCDEHHIFSSVISFIVVVSSIRHVPCSTPRQNARSAIGDGLEDNEDIDHQAPTRISYKPSIINGVHGRPGKWKMVYHHSQQLWPVWDVVGDGCSSSAASRALEDCVTPRCVTCTQDQVRARSGRPRDVVRIGARSSIPPSSGAQDAYMKMSTNQFKEKGEEDMRHHQVSNISNLCPTK